MKIKQRFWLKSRDKKCTQWRRVPWFMQRKSQLYYFGANSVPSMAIKKLLAFLLNLGSLVSTVSHPRHSEARFFIKLILARKINLENQLGNTDSYWLFSAFLSFSWLHVSLAVCLPACLFVCLLRQACLSVWESCKCPSVCLFVCQ